MSNNYAVQLSATQFIVVIGIAVSGIAAFINTYDAIAGIRKLTPTIEETPELRKALKTRFLVFLSISAILIVIGVILAFVTHGSGRGKVISYGLMTAGVLGFIFTLNDRFKGYSIAAKLAVSWISLIVFIALGFYLSKGVPTISLGSFGQYNLSNPGLTADFNL